MRLPLTTIALGAFNALLVTATGMQWMNGSEREELLQAASATSAGDPWQLEGPPAQIDLEGLQSQTVFHKTRAFYVAPAVPTVEAPIPDYRFNGSMSMPNQPLTAVLVSNQTNARTRVKVGDAIEQWTVTHIGARHVSVSLGARTADLGSSPGQRGAGLTVLNGAASVPSPVSPTPQGSVRVLSGPSGAARPGIGSAANVSANDTPRMYRPPSR